MQLASIMVVDSNGTSQPGQLGDATLVIGRAPLADIQVNDPTVSRLHAAAWTENGVVFIKDLGGPNGTFIDGKRLHGTISILPGNEVKLGCHTRLKLELSADGANASTSNFQTTVPELQDPPYSLAFAVGSNAEREEVSIRNTNNLRETRINGTTGAKLLSLLAHALQADRQAEKSSDTQGWRSNESLANDLWKDESEQRISLSVLIHQLRKTLLEQGVDPACIQTEPGMCRIWVEHVTLR